MLTPRRNVLLLWQTWFGVIRVVFTLASLLSCRTRMPAKTRPWPRWTSGEHEMNPCRCELPASHWRVWESHFVGQKDESQKQPALVHMIFQMSPNRLFERRSWTAWNINQENTFLLVIWRVRFLSKGFTDTFSCANHRCCDSAKLQSHKTRPATWNPTVNRWTPSLSLQTTCRVTVPVPKRVPVWGFDPPCLLGGTGAININKHICFVSTSKYFQPQICPLSRARN